jgi:hypothetical protein
MEVHLKSSLVATLGTVALKRLTGNELCDFSGLWHPSYVKQSAGNNMWTESLARSVSVPGSVMQAT